MFCKKCGKEMPDNAIFCSGCGTSPEGEAGATFGHKPPNYEFKTVKCYPNEYTENMHKDFYEACGWQIVDMDRKQLFDGQDDLGTKHYSTSTYIKMQRDKNRPNYERIMELSAKAESYFDTSPNTISLKKDKKYKKAATWSSTFLVLGFCYLPVIGWFISIPFFKKKKKRKLEIEEHNYEMVKSYNENKAKADAAFEECKKLVNR